MDSSLVMELQQAFLQSQLSKQQLSLPDIPPFPIVSFEDESFDRQLQLMGSADPFDLCMELEILEFHPTIIEQEMNSAACLEDDAEIPVDPVLGYISDMLMDEDMEDRRCMFVDSSAYRAMTDELAGLLGDPNSAASDHPHSSVVAEISVSSFSDDDCSYSVAPLDNCGGLYDEILNDPTTKEMAELLESDCSTLQREISKDRVFPFTEDDSSVTDNYPISSAISHDPLPKTLSFDHRKSVDDWIKPLRAESYGFPLSDRHSSIAAVTQHLPAYAPEMENTSAGSIATPLWKENSSPSRAFDQLRDGQSGCLRSFSSPDPANGREELFKLLQKSVASHVGKAKQKLEGEGRSTSSFGGRRLQESESFHERTGVYSRQHNGSHLRKTRSETVGLSSDGYGAGAGDGDGSGKRPWKQSTLLLAADKLEENADADAAADEREDTSDVMSLLTRCAQALAGKNAREANEMVREIRKLASPFGDGCQRVAHYFLEALVARISGTGGSLYTALNNDRRYSAADMLKADQLRIEKCPFIRISHFFSNQTIASACEGQSRLHVVDYGILYGFHWPSLIQTLANRQGGPPRLRITGIDFPQPGIKPSERVEDTGRRLSEFARSCGVAFEYHALAVSRWEDIQPSSLFLRHDEVLAVNCMFRLRHLLDETVMAESPRKKVLARIRSMQPKVFVEAVVNAGYNAPFSFMARFQEALAHFSNVYDAIDSCVTRDHPDRRLLEQEIFGREILNVVACEGLERVERAENYKHWQWRMHKAGFEILPLDRNICNKSKLLMQQYHKDYCLAEDGGWLMVGWKGRFSRCVSAWKPALSPSQYHTP